MISKKLLIQRGKAFTFSFYKRGTTLRFASNSAAVNPPDPDKIATALLEKAVLLLSSRNAREKNRSTVLRNSELIEKARINGLKVSDVFYSSNTVLSRLESVVSSADTRVHKVKGTHGKLNNIIHEILIERSEAIGICEIPIPEPDSSNSTSSSSPLLPVTVVLDNIRNADNLGTIVKLVSILKCRQLLLTKGCVDPWNPKALETGDGCQMDYHHSIRENQSWPIIKSFMSKKTEVIIADALSSFRVSSKESDDKAPVPLRCVKYTDVDFASAEDGVVVVIGGETEGVSREAEVVCAQYGGSKVHIPLRSEIDSLNVGVATSVLLFEIVRQLRNKICL